MTAGAVGVMVVMPVLFRRRGGTGTHCRRSDRTGTGPLARLLLGHFHQRYVHKASPARPTNHLEGNLAAPAVRSGQTGRENVAIQHPCRSSSRHRRPRASAQTIGADLGRWARTGWACSQHAELVVLGVRKRYPAATVGPTE